MSHGQFSDLRPGVTQAYPPQRKFTLVASVGNGESEDLTEGELYLKIYSHECKFSYTPKYQLLLLLTFAACLLCATYCADCSSSIILLNHHEEPFNTHYTSRVSIVILLYR